MHMEIYEAISTKIRLVSYIRLPYWKREYVFSV